MATKAIKEWALYYREVSLGGVSGNVGGASGNVGGVSVCGR